MFPIPWSIEAVAAPDVDQESCVDSPCVIAVGLPIRVQVGSGMGITVRVSVALWERAPLVPPKVMV